MRDEMPDSHQRERSGCEGGAVPLLGRARAREPGACRPQRIGPVGADRLLERGNE